MTGIRQIAPNPSDEYKNLLAKMKEMEKSMVDVRGELTTMHKAICAGFGQGNGPQTSASVSLDNPSVAASSIVRIPAGIASEISCENKDKVFGTCGGTNLLPMILPLSAPCPCQRQRGKAKVGNGCLL
ncbi:hypothetical protein J3Q64DRAFT_1825121 [Phycomyces blakesleeanus]|uniref:Uncharacterized protein n=1 Tax=Phycomyces blakesleeanus TaxID=4837 RepID=A0ABR3APA3_PHYBL